MGITTLEQDRRWPAPAKINLFLHVIGRRSDGYHELQTVFQFLDLCDYLDFERRADGLIERITPVAGVPPEQDLTVRAARLLQQHSGCRLGVRIAIDKRAPMGGGVGGGSSDAATTLVALNELWGLHLDTQTLAGLALKLGADVPIFIHGRAAFAEGIGERLTPIDPPQPWYLLLKPDCAIATAEVFQAPDLTRNTPAITMRAFLAGAGRNDCEPVVTRRYPEVGKALDWLAARTSARLTGTGSCVFGKFDSEAEAQRVGAEVPFPWQGYVVKGMNRSLLLDRLDRARSTAALST